MQDKLHLLSFEQQSAILLVHQNSLQDLFRISTNYEV